LLLRDETDPERRRTLALIVAQAGRVYEMIADLMLFARPPSPQLQRVELVALVDGIIEALGPRCRQQETAICRGGQPGPILIEADPVQLQVALRAICQNSLEALEHDGRIEITIETKWESPNRSTDDASSQQRGEVLIRIGDDGPGLKPAERQHVFEPFYSARQAGRGLGLGLSKAWRIITNHGGRIDVESQPGRGATFTIALAAAVA
jgi:C4-dicarboxylate-specific signal transduction histidine kinase